MKKYFLLTLVSFALYSCSSIELEAVSTSAEETQRILEMGLSHEDNLIEAKMLLVCQLGINIINIGNLLMPCWPQSIVFSGSSRGTYY